MNYKMGQLFNHNNDQWRVTAVTENFIIATRASVTGEPMCPSDVIKVMR